MKEQRVPDDDRAELLEATLNSFPEGVALLGENCT